MQKHTSVDLHAYLPILIWAFVACLQKHKVLKNVRTKQSKTWFCVPIGYAYWSECSLFAYTLSSAGNDISDPNRLLGSIITRGFVYLCLTIPIHKMKPRVGAVTWLRFCFLTYPCIWDAFLSAENSIPYRCPCGISVSVYVKAYTRRCSIPDSSQAIRTKLLSDVRLRR